MASSASGRGSLRDQKTLDDRISQLPDSLLVQILSLLPTNEAFRTSTLSKRWKYLWTSVYNFNFSFRQGYVDEFESFVDHVLAHSSSSKIEKFKLDGHVCSRWLSFAVERKVEDVVLWFEEITSIPESLRTCSSLITLDVKDLDFHSSMPISWKSLKSIKMEVTELTDEDVVNLLAGCPELETMELSTQYCFRRLEINSVKLKRLYLKNLGIVEYGYVTPMEIVAPYLQHFGISGYLINADFRLLDVSSLVSAVLSSDPRFHYSCPCSLLDGEDEEDNYPDYHQRCITLVQDNLQKLSCVTELTLGSWFTEVMCMLLLKGIPIPELKCKYLTLEVGNKFNFYGAVGILRALPHVETLNIEMFKPVGWYKCNFMLRCLAEADNIDLPSWISDFEFPNLKNVIVNPSNSSAFCVKPPALIQSFTKQSKLPALIQSFTKQSKLPAFVLENAINLEKFVISNSMKCQTCSTCSMNCISPFLPYLTKTLLGCPRASTNCVMECPSHD